MGSLPVAFETTVRVNDKYEARDIMVIYDTDAKTFRQWQQGDRPQCSACQITDLSYLVRVKFHEVPTQLLHSVHADSACTVCGKHYIVQSELLAMCPPRTPAPSPANAPPSSSSKLPAVDKPLIEYSIEEVCSWVEGLQMDSTLWRENTITGRDLKHLSDEELKSDLSLTNLQVKKIRREMEQKL